MAVIKCANGHFYDGAKFPECPHCNQEGNTGKAALNEEKTMFLKEELTGSRPKAEKKLLEYAMGQNKKDERTVGFYRSQKGGNPVAGWLVCINGTEWGRDFRIYAGKNKIGRALSMDIMLADDLSVARENHCFLIFEPKKIQFILQKGQGDQVLVDGARLEEILILKGDEEIQIGDSTYIFVPFCREGRGW